MSREVMVVEEPDFLDTQDIDARDVLRRVYRCYGFRLANEIPAGERTFIVAAQAGASAPQPVSREDYFANTLDPVRGKVSAGRTRSVSLRRFARQGNMLVFFFDADP
jgi:hypothetical protein